jgi:hypothetical protein
MDDFFNKLAGRASGGVKAQATGQWSAGASDDLLVWDVRYVALPYNQSNPFWSRSLIIQKNYSLIFISL